MARSGSRRRRLRAIACGPGPPVNRAARGAGRASAGASGWLDEVLVDGGIVPGGGSGLVLPSGSGSTVPVPLPSSGSVPAAAAPGNRVPPVPTWALSHRVPGSVRAAGPRPAPLLALHRQPATTDHAASIFELTATFRHLELPEPVDVECRGETPRALWWRGRHVRVRYAIGPERLAGDWWKDPYARDYWRCAQEDPLAHLLVFRERRTAADQWFVQGWYD
ncbi:MAG: hypothetical protein U0163_08100 [Gemmatimonadaceae bacterium]